MGCRDAGPPGADALQGIREIVKNGFYVDEMGEQRVKGNILVNEVGFLHDLIVQIGARRVLDIGVAKGISFVTMAAALQRNGGGVLYGIDPDQGTEHNHSASRLCRKFGLAFDEIIEDKTLYATARVRERVGRLDFAFIDGWHTFDTTLVDFLLVDVEVGGVVGFHDCYYPSKLKVIRFVLTHRDYQVLGDAAPPRMGLPLRLARAVRNIGRGSANARSPMYWRFSLRTDSSIICLRKRSDWKPNYDFYRSF